MGGFQKCLAPGCASTSKGGAYFRNFPKDPELRSKWLAALPEETKVTANARICEHHFEPSQFEALRTDGKRKLRWNAVPSLWMSSRDTHEDQENNRSSILTGDHSYIGYKPRRIFGDISNQHQEVSQGGKAKVQSVPSEASKLDHSYCSNQPKSDLTVSSSRCGPFNSSLNSPSESVEIPCRPAQSDLTILSSCCGPFDSSLNSPSEFAETPCRPAQSDLTILSSCCGPFDSSLNSPSESVEASFRPAQICPPTSSGRSESLECDLNLPVQTSSRPVQNNFASYSYQELQLMVQKQRDEICRLFDENEIKAKKISILNRALKNHLSIKRKYNYVRSSFERLQIKHNQCRKGLEKLFPRLRPDQISALQRKSTRGLKWSPESIKDGLVLKMRCGTSGYSAFVKLFPFLPSVRSLQSYVQFIIFDSGYIQEIFDLIAVSAKEFSIFEKQCGITLDEMAIKKGERPDPSTKRLLGKCTLPTHSDVAKKALVVMVAGLTRRWKQAVAYFFTNKRDEKATARDTGEAMADIVKTVITKCENAGLEVNFVTCDMGPDNQAWWRYFKIDAARSGHVVHSFPNPAREGAVIYVLPDSPHLYKNVKRTVEVNEVVRIPQQLVESENLPTDVVDYRQIEELCEFESGYELKVAYRLNESNLHCDQHFSKMSVSTSRAVLCHRTGVGLQQMAQEKNDPSFLTTAWFVHLLDVFFKLVTSRHQIIALSRNDLSSYEKAIDIINKVDFLFQHMRIGEEGSWKPCQRGVRILCASILGLQEHCLWKLNFSFLLLGHLTQDCLENLFSCIRLGQPVPNAVAFKQNLKVITLAMFHSFVKGSSYDYDDAEFLVDPLPAARQAARERSIVEAQKRAQEKASNPLPVLTEEDLDSVSQWERCIIYDMAGSVLHSLKNNRKTICSDCCSPLLWTHDKPHPYSTVTQMKEFCALKSSSKEGEVSQLLVSQACFAAVFTVEVMFRKVRSSSTDYRHMNFVEHLVDGLY